MINYDKLNKPQDSMDELLEALKDLLDQIANEICPCPSGVAPFISAALLRTGTVIYNSLPDEGKKISKKTVNLMHECFSSSIKKEEKE